MVFNCRDRIFVIGYRGFFILYRSLLTFVSAILQQRTSGWAEFQAKWKIADRK
jgi:hypothetical protein